MPINPNIALGVRTTRDDGLDPLEQFAKIQGIRNLLAQAPLREAQLERARLENEQTRLENEALPAKQAALVAAQERANQKAALEAEDKELDMGVKKAARIGSLAGSITDEATKDSALGQAIREKLIDPETGVKLLMQSYDTLKPQLKQFTEQALTAQQQAEERRKQIKDQVDAFDFEQKKLLAPVTLAEKTAEAQQKQRILAGTSATGVTAAQQLTADETKKRDAETERHNKQMERFSSARIGMESNKKAEHIISRNALTQAVIDNPALYDKLTPTEVGHIAPELAKKGFTGFGKPPSEAAIKQMSQSRSAIGDLKDLRQTLVDNEQYIGPIAGLQALNPYSDARKAQAKIDLVKQRVGKALEGGVLRKEDEDKYKKILSTLRDTPSTAISKVDGIIETLERDLANYVDEQRRGGRKVTEPASGGAIPKATHRFNPTTGQIEVIK